MTQWQTGNSQKQETPQLQPHVLGHKSLGKPIPPPFCKVRKMRFYFYGPHISCIADWAQVSRLLLSLQRIRLIAFTISVIFHRKKKKEKKKKEEEEDHIYTKWVMGENINCKIVKLFDHEAHTEILETQFLMGKFFILGWPCTKDIRPTYVSWNAQTLNCWEFIS